MDRPRHTGFTLIELLVVVALVALLMAMLLPVMGSARESAREVACRSNLRTIQVGFLTQLDTLKLRIPGTRTNPTSIASLPLPKPPYWTTVLDNAFPGVPLLWYPEAGTFNTCPTVRQRYLVAAYASQRWGYAINTRWFDTEPEPGYPGNATTAFNQFKPWHGILHPSDYPWLMDPKMYPFASPGMYTAHDYTPRISGSIGGLHADFGVGAHHQQQQGANVVFADGSARYVDMVTIRGDPAGPGDLTWFHNR